ncbi:MAG: hypothetical protein MJ206_03400 [Bacilli bacterium]|nr:hypothetical protein [Bacilli bacterium]
MPLIAVSLLASCNKGGGGDEPKSYTVTCTEENVTLSNLVASNEKDYETTITVNEDKISKSYCLPETLKKITVSEDKEIKDYTYSRNGSIHSANLLIPKKT